MSTNPRLEVLNAVYSEVRPKTFKEFWQSFKHYKTDYPLLLKVSFKEAKELFDRKRMA